MVQVAMPDMPHDRLSCASPPLDIMISRHMACPSPEQAYEHMGRVGPVRPGGGGRDAHQGVHPLLLLLMLRAE